jgi:hypothetical protein
MKSQDMPRFGAAMFWLAKKYPLGRDDAGKPKPRSLDASDLKDYFEALADLSIDAIERGVKWHYGHSEFFPDRPGSLRKSVESAPRPPAPALQGREQKLLESKEMTEERVAENRRRLQEIIDSLGSFDATYGTNLKEKVSRRERLAILEEQKKQILT